MPGQETLDVVGTARQLAFAKHRAEALSLLSQRMVTSPTDDDARTLYGIILSWEGRYDEARNALEEVIGRTPDHWDALPALVNVELWSGHPKRAEELAREGQRLRPGNTDLLLRRCRALWDLNRKPEALDLVNGLLALEPGNEEAQTLRTRLSRRESREEAGAGKSKWEQSITQSFEWFSDGRQPWRETEVQLKYRTATGPITARFTRANHFGYTSNLVEFDTYQTFRPGTYAYFSGGFSPDKVFYAKYILGGELFQRLGHGFEASGGIRHMQFNSPVNIFTTSLSKYKGNWLFMARTLTVPGSTGASNTFLFTSRRYFGDGDNYIAFRVGHGAGPADTRTIQDREILHSSSLLSEVHWRLKKVGVLQFRGGTSQEDRLSQNGLYHYILDASMFFQF